MKRGREALAEILSTSKRAPRIKVAAKPERTVDGILFASKREASHYRELLQLQQVGAVRFFLRQVPFHLPGGVKYLADFVVWWMPRQGPDGQDFTVEDVKGHETELYRLKKRQVEALYPIKIREV